MARIDRKINELDAIDTPVAEDLLVIYDVSSTTGIATKKLRIDQLPSTGSTTIDLVIPVYANVAALPTAPTTVRFAYVQSNNSLYFSNTTGWVRLDNYTVPIETLSGQIEAPANKTYVLEQRAAYPYYVDGISLVTGSGTAQATLQVNGVSVSGLSNIAVTTSAQRLSVPQAVLVPLGARLTLVISSVTGALDLSFTVETSKV